MKKRRLSTIVMTMILIVISLAAVGIFWIVIRNVVKGGTEQVGLGKFTVDADIKNVNVDNSSNNVSFTVQRNAGEGEVSGIKFIFSNETGTEIITEDFALKELEPKKFIFHLGMNVSGITKISIAPIFSSNGKETYGNVVASYDVKTGVSFKVQDSSCTPATCATLGYNCGSGYANGSCGGTLSCGTFGNGSCQTGYSCVGGNCQLGCAPATCASLNYECGSVDNGCGTTLNCNNPGCGINSGCSLGTCVCNSNWGDCNNDNSCECDLSSNSCVGGSCVSSNVITALSCSSTDVQNAINNATSGATVQIPAGNCTWTSPGDYQARITINKGIIIRGNGQDSTVITADNARLIKVNGVGGDFRLTGIGFKGSLGSAGQALIWIDGTFGSMRVDHCKFTDITGGRVFMVGYYTPYSTNPAVKGLFDHITHLNTVECGRFMLYYGKDNSWLSSDDFGSDNAIYVEDSEFSSSDSCGILANVLDGEHGARFVVRNNKITNTGIRWHDAGSTPQARGTRIFEIYNNTFFCSALDCGWSPISLRGGTGFVYNNLIPTPNPYGWENPTSTQIFRNTQIGGKPWIGTYCDGTVDRICSDFRSHCNGGDYRACEGNYNCVGVGDGTCSIDACTQDNQCGGGNTCLVKMDGKIDSFGCPCRDQNGRGQDDLVTHVQASSPSYFWNNKDSRNPSIQLSVYIRDADYIKPNRDYYDYTSSFTGVSGVGMGLRSARPATCAMGVGYWASDEKRLYQCTSTNTWNLYYVPYAYPHPLTLIN